MALPAANKLPERSQIGARHLTETQPSTGEKTLARSLPSRVSSCSVTKTRESVASSATTSLSSSRSLRHVAPPAAETTTIWPSTMSDLSSQPAHGRVTRTRSPTVSAHQTAAWYGSTPFLRRRMEVLDSFRVTVAPFLLRTAARMPSNGCGIVAPPTLRPSMVRACRLVSLLAPAALFLQP